MQIGAVFPQLEIGTDPAVIRQWAETVEEVGYRHAVAYDHVLGAGTADRPGWRGYTDESLFHEVFVLFGYLAAITTELELVTGVLVLPQRQTALVAKQATEVDVLSGGRLRLGVGIGWNHVEYQALGVPFERRGARLTEQVQLLRRLWAEQTITYNGRFHDIEDAGLKPLPVRRNIPVWFGGSAEAVLRRTGRIGDGWMPQSPPHDEARAQVERLRAYAAEAGRNPGEVGIEARLTLGAVPEKDWADFAAGWRALGATHLGVNTMGMGLSGPSEHAAVLRDVLPVL
ncbi:MAG TPA: LLM class F420-dependent oxidoreductase [Kribbella sp.]|nr:LLM class F420-dependent oxidoreductase [Kribbella sp.]